MDPGPQGQRPWPGPPAAPVPVTLDATAELARGDQGLSSSASDQQWEEVVVPAESVLGLQLESSISTEFARVENTVDARVTRDVRVGGRVAIPAGTRAVGSVVMVDRGGRVKDRARIGIRFNTLILPDTTRLTINTEPVYREGQSPAGQSSAKIGGATIGGAILGAILGGGRGAAIGSGIGAAGGTAAAMNGDRMPITLPAGTTMSVRTLTPINMTVER
jgi:type IV secretory pathway VirB10-like protein